MNQRMNEQMTDEQMNKEFGSLTNWFVERSVWLIGKLAHWLIDYGFPITPCTSITGTGRTLSTRPSGVRTSVLSA